MGSFTPPPTPALAPGDRLDRYELLCVLAQGGMGTVWLARLSGKLGFERLVALKTILPSYTQDPQFCAMFLDEAGIAAQVDHENVARILEIGEDRGFLYYAMDLIDGESVRKLYRDVRAQGQVFPLGVALRIAADACAGLHAVHELRGPDGRPLEVVHRDVSPQNVLLTTRGTTKLIDFGVAKARERRTEETTAGTLKGKLEYMAPEQAAGEPIDRRADVYAIGAILYELLAGRPVRDTEEGRQLVALHELVTGAPYPPLPANVPHLVRSVIDRALSRDPRQRYRTTDELRHALEQAMLATGQGATTDDVARVLAHYARDRIARRKEAIDAAVRAASSGKLDGESAEEARQDKTVVAPIERLRGGVRTGPHLPPYGATGTGPYPVLAGPPIVGAPPPGDGPPTGPSMRTMEGAALSAHPPGFAPPARRSSATRVVAGVTVLGLVALLGVVAGVFLAQGGLPTTLAATVGPPASAEPAAAPTPVPVPMPVASSAEPAPIAPPPVATEEPSASPAASTSAPPPAASSARAAAKPAPPSRRAPAVPRAARGGGSKADDEYGF